MKKASWQKYVYTTAGGGIAATPSPQSPPLFTLLAFFTLKDNLYAHIWLLQLYWQVLFLPWSSSPEELCPPMQVPQVDSELFYQRMMGICVPRIWSGWACPVGLQMSCSLGSSKYRQQAKQGPLECLVQGWGLFSLHHCDVTLVFNKEPP